MINDENKIPVGEVLRHLAGTADAAAAAGEGFECVVLLLVDKKGGWAGALGGERAADLNQLLLNARDSLVRGEESFTLFIRRDAPDPARVPSSNGAVHAMNDDEQEG